jgi:glyoxylase-like metal-dependent hydrolase (beta-lactamase superfamily II)
MELVPGVHQVDGTGWSNAFLVVRPEGLVLVDAGTPSAARAILRYIEALGRPLGDVQAVLVTHSDADHIGGLGAVKEATSAEVVADEAEVPFVEGRQIRGPARMTPLMRVWAPIVRLVMPVKPVHVDRAVRDRDAVLGFTVFATPGHSPGSASYSLSEKGVLFVGDAMRNTGGRLSLPAKAFTTDAAQAAASVKAIAALDFDVCCFGHGPSIIGGAQAAVREFAESLR